MHRLHLLLLLLLSLLPLAACGAAKTTPAAEDRPISVVTTTGMIADVVRAVGGNHVEVTQLMGPGIDPHLYKATESDVARLSGADVIFYSGLNLEARMTDVFQHLARSRRVAAVADAIPQDLWLASPRYENQPDPHVWMDPKLWSYTIDPVTAILSEMAPAHAPEFDANANAYRQQLSDLSAYVLAQVERVPASQRVLITAHDAFQYFGRGYGYEVFAPQGISTEAEAGVEDIRRIIDIVVERNIPAIFVESSVPPDVVEAIVAGARDRGHELSIGGSLFSDAMGDASTPAGTYPGMIRHNIDTIVAPVVP